MRRVSLLATAVLLMIIAGLSLLPSPRPYIPQAARPLQPRNEPMPWVESRSQTSHRLAEEPESSNEEMLAFNEPNDDRDLARGRDIHISNPWPGSSGFKAYSVGSRRELRAAGGTKESKDLPVALTDGLSWLARHQEVDGHWSSAGFDKCCLEATCAGPGYQEFDVGVTGLAVLAFLHCGYTPLSRAELPGAQGQGRLRTGEVVKRGLAWLMKQQKPDGFIGPRGPENLLINDAAAAWALGEAAGLTHDNALRQSAALAVDFLLSSQQPYSGWTGSLDRQPDLVSTAWAFRALAASEAAGIPFPRRSRDGIAAFFESLRTSRGFGSMDLSVTPGGRKVAYLGRNEDWDGHPVGAAIALLALPLCDRQPREIDLLFATALAGDLPQYAGKSIDYHAWNFAAAALALRAPEFPDHATAFREAARNALLPSQKTRQDGCSCGSWDADVDRWGFAGGRVYATAINLMTLVDLGTR